MIVWGVVSMLTMFVTDVVTFYIARVVLGIAEAGFFPGVVLYLTYWIPAEERARTGALFMMAAPVAIIVGAPVSEAILSLDGWLGLHGWQWLFLLEGLPAVLLGLVALWALTDRPEQASWLPAEDREWLSRTMNAERARRNQTGHVSIGRSFASGRVWLLCAVYFLNTTVTYGIFLWLPKILADASGSSGYGLEHADVDSVRRGAHRDGGRRAAFGSHRRAQAPRGRVRGDGGDGLAARGRLPGQYVAAGPQLHALADGAAVGDERVLGDAADDSRRRGRGCGHRAHQRDRQPRRVLRPIDHGHACVT